MIGRYIAALLSVLVLIGCSGESELPAHEQVQAVPTVYTVNYPLAWMATALAAPAVEVYFPAPPDVDPAFWEPDIDTVLAYQRADLVLLNGANFARWINRVSLSGDTLRDTSINYHKRLIPIDSGPVHSHGPAGDHSHGEVAFTTWLDLEQAQMQLQSVAVALAEVLSDADVLELADREREITALLAGFDAELTALGAALEGSPLLYSHPVYQYLDRRYGLNGAALHWEPGEMPDQAQWAELENILREHPARLMLWESQPLPEVTARLSSLGLRVVVFHPMGNTPATGDFVTGMRENIQQLGAGVSDIVSR